MTSNDACTTFSGYSQCSSHLDHVVNDNTYTDTMVMWWILPGNEATMEYTAFTVLNELGFYKRCDIVHDVTMRALFGSVSFCSWAPLWCWCVLVSEGCNS